MQIILTNKQTNKLSMQTQIETKVALLDNITPELREEVKDILVQTNLNWDVRKEDLISFPSNLPTPNSGVYRNDTNNYLGTASKKYTIYQNSELIETIHQAAKQFGMTIVDGGSLYDGVRVYLQLQFPDEYVGNSQIKRYITAVNSHNGLGSVGFGSTNDILNITSVSSSKYRFFRMYNQMDKFRHCSIVQQRVKTAVNQLFQTITQENKTILLFKKMAECKVEDELLREIMMKCYAIDLNAATSTMTPRQEKKANDISFALTQEINKQDGTVWGLFNGIIKLTDYNIPAGKSTNDFVMAGTGYAVNMKAFNTINEFLNKF